MPRTVDTRFFLTHFLPDAGAVQSKTRAKIIQLQRESAVVPTIGIHEVCKFTCQHLGRDAARLRVASILKASFRIVPLDEKIAVASGELRCRTARVPTADAIIAATASAHKALPVVTDDPHFRDVLDVPTEWL